MSVRKDVDLRRRDALRIGSGAAAALGLGLLPFGMRAEAADGGLKIGVIGSGRLGGTLGGLWLKAGHEVMFSSLDIEQDKALAARLGGKARAGTTRDAAAFGEVILLAVPYSAVPAIGREVGELLKGKVLVDASNPIAARDGEVGSRARERGAGIATAEFIPGARIVRAFNAIGYSRLPEAAQRAEKVGMPMASDDAGAVSVVSRLVRDVGYEPVLVGSLAMGRYLIPGTPLAGEQPPEKLRQVAATLK